MPSFYKGKIPIITRNLDEGFVQGLPEEATSTGCVPRDYCEDPVVMGDSPDGMKLIDPSEYDARFDADEANESSLEHIYLRAALAGQFKFLDQNGFPDCWFHSTAHAVMLNRLAQGLPYVALNAVAGATLLKQTNGGWCGLSMKFVRRHGCPVVGTGSDEWPYQSRRGRDTPELRARMALYKSEEDWYDLGRQEWDQKLSSRQLATCSFNNQAAPSDFNRAAHSVCQVRWVRVERGAWAPLVLNSWKGWGYHGLGVLLGWAADNAVAVRSSTPTAETK